MRIQFVLIFLLLCSCAQVGVLSGGKKDETAPRPKLEKMLPKNSSTNFNGKQLIIPFDEYIKLNNPSETIIVVPPNIKPIAKVVKKSLVLSWEEDLLPNTTYAFYLNGTVQDIRESNDSLMTFVFSSGETIDHLSATFFVQDAFTKEPLKGAIVGLYENFSDTVRPTYFAQTDTQGKVQLSYLKEGDYQLVAFSDKNKDLKHQPDELLGYKNEIIHLSDSLVDSLPVRMYLPQTKPRITHFSYLAPGAFVVASNRNLENAVFRLNDVSLDTTGISFFEKDSVVFPVQVDDTNRYTLIVETPDWVDTSSIRVTQKEKKGSIQLFVQGGKDLLPKKPVSLFSSVGIRGVDTAKVRLFHSKDSIFLPLQGVSFRNSEIEVQFDRQGKTEVDLLFLPHALETASGGNEDTLVVKLTCLPEKELGSLVVDVSSFQEPLILQLLNGGKIVQSIPLSPSIRKHHFNYLKAQDYSFRLIYDENENGQWDVGNRELGLQPEGVENFPETKKVRPNWDLEIILEKTKNGN